MIQTEKLGSIVQYTPWKKFFLIATDPKALTSALDSNRSNKTFQPVEGSKRSKLKKLQNTSSYGCYGNQIVHNWTKLDRNKS